MKRGNQERERSKGLEVRTKLLETMETFETNNMIPVPSAHKIWQSVARGLTVHTQSWLSACKTWLSVRESWLPYARRGFPQLAYLLTELIYRNSVTNKYSSNDKPWVDGQKERRN